MSTEDITSTKASAIALTRKVAMGMTPIAPLSAFLVGGNLVAELIAALALLAVAYASSRVAEKSQAIVLSVVLIGQCVAFTSAFAGHPWQLDSHMMFFAVLAIIATMGSVPALLAGVAVTAVHHLAFGLLAPSLVFPSLALFDVLGRVVFHAVIVLFEAAILLWSMIRSQQAEAQIISGRAELSKSAAAAEEAQVEAEATREQALEVAARTRKEGQKAAVAVEEISAAASAAAETASNARAVVEQTRSYAEGSGAVVHRAMDAMDAIKTSSSQIDTIITVIDEIARQTDLLALNAAVESARAGEAGRGFAVVADEVRVLSQRTHASTEEIKATIDILQQTTTRAVSLMDSSSNLANTSVSDADQATNALSEIHEAVSLISDMATQIATAAEEQTHVTGEITQNITSIKDVADELVISTQESSQESTKLKLQAQELTDKVATFKLS